MAKYPDYSQPAGSSYSAGSSYPDYSKPLGEASEAPPSAAQQSANYIPSMMSPTSALQIGGVQSMKYHPLTTQLALSAPLAGIGAGPGLLNALTRMGIGTAAGTALGMADQNNMNTPGQTAGYNAAGNALLEGIPLAGKGISSAYNYIQPGKYAESILNALGDGQNLASNGRIFANKIKGAYESAKAKGSDLYNDVFNRRIDKPNNSIGDSTVSVQSANASAGNNIDNSSSLGANLDGIRGNTVGNQSIMPSAATTTEKAKLFDGGTIDKFTPDLKDLHDDFLASPTLNNAHKLQSQLGFEVRRLEKMDKKANLSAADNNVLQTYRKARNQVKDKMNQVFDDISPELKDQYNAANEHYLNNVVPYLQNPKISAIVKTHPNKITGKHVNNIGAEFRNPDEDIQKIVSDVGPDANNHIVYDRLSKLTGKVSPEKLRSEINNLKNQGYEDYVSPELESMMSKLGRREGAQSGVGKGLAVLAGLGLGHHFGGSAAELAGLGIGGMTNIGKGILNNIPVIPGIKLSPNVLNSISQTYRTAGRTGINALANQQGNQ